MAIVTNTPLTMSYFIRDITTALVTFNRLRWYRSRSGPDGLYEAATDTAATAAILVGADTEPHEISGKTLSFVVNGVTQVDVTFAAADPVDTTTAAGEINGATALVVADADGSGRLRLTTATTGSGASVEILESEAAPFLGFQTGDAAVGQDTDTVLVAGTHEYFYTDQNSDADFWYRVKFLHSATADESELTPPFPASAVQAVPKSQTIVAFMRLVDLTGCPIENRKVTLSNTFLPNRVDINADSSAGVFRGFFQKDTDRNGYVEFRVLRGIEIDVSVEGTSFVRRITVPITGDSVDLLDPTLESRDEFGIQEQDIDFAIRLS
jgi:hypothetical protein